MPVATRSAPTLRRQQTILGSTGGANPCFAPADKEDRDPWPALHALSYSKGQDVRNTVTAQASSDQVCILASDQDFSQALPFWDAFSSSDDSGRTISCVCVGTSAGQDVPLVAAAMDHRIAVWSATSSAASSRKWKVHSTLMISDGEITSLDIVQGHLLVGTTSSLSLWRLESSEILLWRRFWTKLTPAPIRIARFSPDASIIAAVVEGGQNVLLWQYQPRSSRLPQLQQRLFHPYCVINIVWRQPPETNSQSDVLVSYGLDGVARIWAPVIDEPTQLRLWCTIEGAAAASEQPTACSPRAFYLDPFVLCSALRTNVSVLQRELQMIELGVGKAASLTTHEVEMQTDLKRTRLRRLEQMASETPDMFLCLEPDGTVSVTAVANIDRRPPTLLQTFTVLRVPLSLPVPTDQISSLIALPLSTPASCSSEVAMLTFQLQTTSGSSMTFIVNPALFFDGRGLGIQQAPHPCSPLVSKSAGTTASNPHRSLINKLVRSGSGTTLLSSAGQETITWKLEQPDADASPSLCLSETRSSCLLSCVSGDGLQTVTLSAKGDLELHRLSDKAIKLLSSEVEAAHICFGNVGGVQMLFAITLEGKVRIWSIETTSLSLAVQEFRPSSLSGSQSLFNIIESNASLAQSSHGVNLFTSDERGSVDIWSVEMTAKDQPKWNRTQHLCQSSTPVTKLSCSAAGFVAIVSGAAGGEQKLTILDTTTTAFSSGEEYSQTFSSRDDIVALDWSPSPQSEACLAVAFRHHVLILCPARRSAADEIRHGHSPSWTTVARIDPGSCSPSRIRAICWLAGEKLAIASAALLFVHGPIVDNIGSMEDEGSSKHLAEVIAAVGGPVTQYHPSFLHQSALWHKMELAKRIILNLEEAVSNCSPQDLASTWRYTDVSLDLVMKEGNANAYTHDRKAKTLQNGSIFDTVAVDDDTRDPFAADSIEALVEKLKTVRPPHLSDDDVKVLPILIRTIGEAERERRSMDETGLRYMLALRLLLNLEETLQGSGAESEAPNLSYRECVWAFHSDNQEPLLGAIGAAFHSRFNWQAARATGIFTWIKNPQTLRAQAEAVARAQFMTGEDRDPVKCSLLYYALGKRKVVQGLWKQAIWHPEQKKMLQFLSKDFDDERWRTAAQKNAFALLSQRRYEFAASFFMLGDSLRDAVNVCVRNLNDLSLAIALARLREGTDDGPVFTELLRTRLLPVAFEKGDRWLGSWTFWMLKRRDLAVRIIITPLAELLQDPDVASMLPSGQTCGNDNYDDASLALLFRQLKVKSLQTLKGLADIPEKKEFDFVLHTNRVLCRMGCDAIGLSLLRNWQFEPPTVPSSATLYHQVSKHDLDTLSRVDENVVDGETDYFVGDRRSGSQSAGKSTHARRDSSQGEPTSPRMPRRRSSLLQRRSSIINDLDIGRVQHAIQNSQSNDSDAMSRFLTSEPLSQEPAKVDVEAAKPVAQPPAVEPKKGISVFKSAAAANSQQGAQEFDFGSFGF